MVEKIYPELNQVQFLNQYTMLHILEGNGGIEVDFKKYHDWKDKLIFLEKGQYIKFLSEDFIVRKIEFQDEKIFRNKDVRVLFKHLVSLGYINFNECTTCQEYLNGSILSDRVSKIVDISSEQWFWQNPFQASQEEYHVIFDVKDIIDDHYRNNLTNEKLSSIIGDRGYNAHALFHNKIGITIRSLLNQKKILEGKRQIAFTDKSIKEVAYDLGYKDPAYFTRNFKKTSGKSPSNFREDVQFDMRDSFLPELYDLLKKHHKSERKLEFYANQMNVSVKTLSSKVKNKLSLTLGQLIRQELLNTAKALITADLTIKEVAFELGFEEANHFSTFFKHYTTLTPLDYKESMSHS